GSTTAAIIGGVCGVGLASAGCNGIQWSALLTKVFIALGLSPVIAMIVAFLLFPASRWLLSGWKGHCICVIPVQKAHLVVAPNGSVAMISATTDIKTVVDSSECDVPQLLSVRLGSYTFHSLTTGRTCWSWSLYDT